MCGVNPKTDDSQVDVLDVGDLVFRDVLNFDSVVTEACLSEL